MEKEKEKKEICEVLPKTGTAERTRNLSLTLAMFLNARQHGPEDCRQHLARDACG